MSEVKNELKNELLGEIIGLTSRIERYENSINEYLDTIEDWKCQIERLKERKMILTTLIENLETTKDEES